MKNNVKFGTNKITCKNEAKTSHITNLQNIPPIALLCYTEKVILEMFRKFQ